MRGDRCLGGCSHVVPHDGAAGHARIAPGTGADSTRLTDANILAKMAGSDSSEVAVARSVQPHLASAGAKAFAQMLIDDHSKARAETDSLARALSITPEPPANDTTAQQTEHLITRFSSMQGTALDTAFVHHEVKDHRHDIADTRKMIGQAQHQQVKHALRKSLPVLEKHLHRAQSLERQSARSR